MHRIRAQKGTFHTTSDASGEHSSLTTTRLNIHSIGGLPSEMDELFKADEKEHSQNKI